MATESELSAYIHRSIEVIGKAYDAAMRDGSIPAMGREMVKDVRATLHEVFFSRGEHGSEPGAPMHPLLHDIVEARKAHETVQGAGQPAAERLATPGVIVREAEEHRGGVHGPQQAQGTVQGDIYGYDQGRGQHAPAPGGVYGPEHGVYGPEKGVYGRDHAAPGPLPTPGEIADDRGQDAPLGRGVEVAQVGPEPPPGGWAKQILNERKGNQGGNDQNELARGRVLPDEQLENNKGRDR